MRSRSLGWKSNCVSNKLSAMSFGPVRVSPVVELATYIDANIAEKHLGRCPFSIQCDVDFSRFGYEPMLSTSMSMSFLLMFSFASKGFLEEIRR